MKQELPIAVCLLAAGILCWSWQSPSRQPATSAEITQSTTDVQHASFDRTSETVENQVVVHHFATSPPRPAAEFRFKGDNAEAGALLRQSQHMLEQSPAFQTGLKIQARLFGQAVQGSGTYLQMGQGSGRTRTTLNFKTEHTHRQLLQLCDGRFVYHLTSDMDNDDLQLEFYDLKRIQRAADESKTTNARSAWPPAQKFFAGGSVAGLLQHLADSFRFGSIAASPSPDSESFTIHGVWTPLALHQLLGDQLPLEEIQQGVSWDRLPNNLPHAVQIQLSSSEMPASLKLFPTEITFFRFETHNGKTMAQPAVVLRLAQPQILTDLPADLFVMDNLELEANDVTKEYISKAQQQVESGKLR